MRESIELVGCGRSSDLTGIIYFTFSDLPAVVLVKKKYYCTFNIQHTDCTPSSVDELKKLKKMKEKQQKSRIKRAF